MKMKIANGYKNKQTVLDTAEKLHDIKLHYLGSKGSFNIHRGRGHFPTYMLNHATSKFSKGECVCLLNGICLKTSFLNLLLASPLFAGDSHIICDYSGKRNHLEDTGNQCHCQFLKGVSTTSLLFFFFIFNQFCSPFCWGNQLYRWYNLQVWFVRAKKSRAPINQGRFPSHLSHCTAKCQHELWTFQHLAHLNQFSSRPPKMCPQHVRVN